MSLGTDFEFRSPKFRVAGGEDRAPSQMSVVGVFATYLHDKLRERGIEAGAAYCHVEWELWIVPVRHQASTMWVGCGLYGGQNDCFFGFIAPTPPPVKQTPWQKVLRLFIKIKDTASPEVVAHFAEVLDGVLTSEMEIQDVHWWTDQSLC